MKKRIVLILSLCMIGFHAMSQDKFIDMLDSLSIYYKKVNTKIPQNNFDYFSNMQNGQNFTLKRDTIEREIICVNENENISVYIMVPLQTFEKKMKPVGKEKQKYMENVYKYIMLFDKKDSRCFSIKYYPGMRSHCSFWNINKNQSSISVDLRGKIIFIIELDNCFNPISSARFIAAGYDSFNRGDYWGRFAYKSFGDKTQVIQIQEKKEMNIFKISYEDLKDELSLEDYVYNEADKHVGDLNVYNLFESLEFGW